MTNQLSVFWFRRDLRLFENAALYNALRSGHQVLPIFIFDKNILKDINHKADKRVQFIHDQIRKIQEQLVAIGSTLDVMYDIPLAAFRKLVERYKVCNVYTNHDYEPYATMRDAEVMNFLKENGIEFISFKDQVIFEKNEIIKENNDPYTVFTPYSKKWKEKLNPFYYKSYPTEKYFSNFYKTNPIPVPSITQIGFHEIKMDEIPISLDKTIAANYNNTRDFPGLNGTTKLSVHLRFGTISIRQLVAEAMQLNESLLNELIWREFYMMILWHFPYVVNGSFKREYDNIRWNNNEEEFQMWCEGKTGYPIVDAGMRQLNETGYMHNRVRMIVASFLTKHLLIDWRWGESYFLKNYWIMTFLPITADGNGLQVRVAILHLILEFSILGYKHRNLMPT